MGRGWGRGSISSSMTIHNWRKSLKPSSRCLQKCRLTHTTTNNAIHSWSSIRRTSLKCCPKKTSSSYRNKSKSSNSSPRISITTRIKSSSSTNSNNSCKRHNFCNNKFSNCNKSTTTSKTILLTLLFKVIASRIVYRLLNRRWVSVRRSKNSNSSLCTCLIITSIFLLIRLYKRGLKVRLRNNSFLKLLKNCLLLRDKMISSRNRNLWTQLPKRTQ